MVSYARNVVQRWWFGRESLACLLVVALILNVTILHSKTVQIFLSVARSVTQDILSKEPLGMARFFMLAITTHNANF